MGTTMGRAAFLAPLGNWRAERLPLRTELSRLLVEWLGASLGAEAQAAAQGVMRRLGPCLREAPRVRSAARRGEPPHALAGKRVRGMCWREGGPN